MDYNSGSNQASIIFQNQTGAKREAAVKLQAQ